MPRVISDELFNQLIREIKDGKKLGGEGRWVKLEKDSPRVGEGHFEYSREVGERFIYVVEDENA